MEQLDLVMGCKTGFRDLRTYYFFFFTCLRVVVHYLPTNKKINKKRLAWEEKRNNLELQVNEIRFAFAIFSWVTHTRELLTWHAYRNLSAVNEINKLSTIYRQYFLEKDTIRIEKGIRIGTLLFIFFSAPTLFFFFFFSCYTVRNAIEDQYNVEFWIAHY